MPEHYPLAMVEVRVWCKVCNKETMHRVDNRRRGPCLACIKKREDEHNAALAQPTRPAPKQLEMF